MAQRLLRIVLPADGRDRLHGIFEDAGQAIGTEVSAEGGLLVAEAVVPAEGNEPLMDALESTFGTREGFHVLILPLSASLPRPTEEEPPKEEGTGAVEGPAKGAKAGEEAERPPRLNREELYDRITDMGELSGHYLVMVALSAVVASVGLLTNSPAAIVGAMVIAPLLGPHMALALSTTLGDVGLGREAVRSALVGLAVAFAVALAWGFFVTVDPVGGELGRAAQASYSEVALALAAGAAGVLSVSRDTATALVGVMVAVALLPPLVASGLFLGSGHRPEAVRALTLVAANVICINLAGVVTFLVQGVRPRTWWEEDRARTAVRVALSLWFVLLAVLVFVIHRLRSG